MAFFAAARSELAGFLQVSRERRAEATVREAAKTATEKKKCIFVRLCDYIYEDWSEIGNRSR